MRLRDVIATEGVWDGFKKGYTKVGGKELGTDWKPKKSEPVAKTPEQSPFNMLSNSEAKDILGAVLGQKTLDSSQIAKLQRIYDKL